MFTPATPHWLPHTGYPTPATPHRLPHTGYPTPATPHRLPHTGYPTPATPHWLPHTGYPTPARFSYTTHNNKTVKHPHITDCEPEKEIAARDTLSPFTHSMRMCVAIHYKHLGTELCQYRMESGERWHHIEKTRLLLKNGWWGCPDHKGGYMMAKIDLMAGTVWTLVYPLASAQPQASLISWLQPITGSWPTTMKKTCSII